MLNCKVKIDKIKSYESHYPLHRYEVINLVFFESLGLLLLNDRNF